MLPHVQPRLCTPQAPMVPAFTNNYNNGTPTITTLPGLLPQPQPMYTNQTGPSASPDTVPAMSPALSSAPTSASEVSELLIFTKNCKFKETVPFLYFFIRINVCLWYSVNVN